MTEATVAAGAYGVQKSDKAGFRNNPKWAWSTTANKMDAVYKILEGSLQYVSIELDSAAAKVVPTKISEYAATSWVGSFDNSSADSGSFAASAIAAPTVVSVAPVVTGALSLASIGATIALVMAF